MHQETVPLRTPPFQEHMIMAMGREHNISTVMQTSLLLPFGAENEKAMKEYACMKCGGFKDDDLQIERSDRATEEGSKRALNEFYRDYAGWDMKNMWDLRT